MTLVQLLSWIAIGAVIGAIVATMWKSRDLLIAEGIVVGGAGGSAGGLIGQMIFPESAVAAPMLGAVVVAVLACLIGGAEAGRQSPKQI